jgi:hypothetical protein
MKPKYQILTLIVILMIAGLACGQFQFGIENPTPVPSNDEAVLIDTPEPEPEIIPENTPVSDVPEGEDFSQYWVEAEDPRTGLRFAIPCFWVVDMPPQQNNAGLGSFSVNNFTQDFITSLGPKRGGTVWEIGGLKFDLGYHTMAEYGLSPTSSLEDLAVALVNPDSEHGITSTEWLEISGKMSLKVNTWGTFGEGSFYLLPYTNNFNILFAPAPDANHPDIQAILHSMALDPNTPVQLPTILPSDPPEGMAAPCMGQIQQAGSSSDASPLSGTLDCNQIRDTDGLMWVICNVQASFRSRNTQPLLGYMGEPFKIGYWQSEGVERTREEALREFENNLIPPNPSQMTFTLDESLFPPLFGMQPEQIFPPDANIVEVVYSEGWGQDGQGAALLYFSEKPNGGYYFYGIVIAGQHFDK